MENDMMIILVTDSLRIERAFSQDCNDSEGYAPELVRKMIEALHELSDNVIHYDSLKRFIDNLHIYNDKNVVVIPAYFGVASSSSKSLVPAICESYHIKYVGSDAYTQAICNDKYLSKLYAAKMGVCSGDAVLVRTESDASSRRIEDLSYPVVVKPNHGGGSNGIVTESVCRNPEDARFQALSLLESQNIPIIVEEYLPGYEIQVTFSNMPDGSVLSDQTLICLNGKQYFTESIFDLEAKKRKPDKYALKETDMIPETEMAILRKLFQSFSRADMMRIDCRVDTSGAPMLIELSPDCSLAPKSGLYSMFRRARYSYSQMFEALIGTSLLNYS